MTAVRIVPEGRLVWGLQLPVAAQSTVFAQPWEANAGPGELLRVAQTCDRVGCFYVAVCDHVCVPRASAAAMSTVWYDTVATLGFLAAATTRVRLLSYVWIAPYRHPLQTAKAFMTPAARGDGWLPQGTFRDQLPAQIETIRAHRRKVRGDDPIEIGANSPWLYVGKPPFDVGANAVTGSAERIAASLRELKALGVSHCGVRFRTRSCDELCDQLEAFASQVAPLLDA